GDGVLLHPAYPRTAPRHGRTVGRPWLLTPSAVFNLAGVPVTEVPLGLTPRGLPIGVQVAAAPGLPESGPRRGLRRSVCASDGSACTRGARRRVCRGRAPLRRRALIRPGR